MERRHTCYHVFFLKKTGDSNMILLNDGLTINLPCEQGSQKIHWTKESFDSLMDAHVIVL